MMTMGNMAGVKVEDQVVVHWNQAVSRAAVTAVSATSTWLTVDGCKERFRVKDGTNYGRHTWPYLETVEQFKVAQRLSAVVARLDELGVEIRPRHRDRYALVTWERVLAVLEEAASQPAEAT
jgi:hypothetical protein